MKKIKHSYSIILETAEPSNKKFIQFLKKNNIKASVVEKAAKSHSGFDEIEFKAKSDKALESLINHFWHDEALKENIE